VRSEVSVEAVAGDREDVLRLAGPLSLATVPALRDAVGKALARRGRVVADLSGVDLQWEPGVTLFTTALVAAGGWPTARLALCGAPPRLERALQLARVTGVAPHAADVDSARPLLTRRPPRVLRQHDLACDVGSPASARAFLSRALDDWDAAGSAAAGAAGPAAQVVTELVSNAVQHARTPCRVLVTLDDRALRIGVRDFGRPARVRARPIAVGAPAGRGLHLVALLSRTWGVFEHGPGRTVWADLAV
jgi:anti-anti-sigma regulatory factor